MRNLKVKLWYFVNITKIGQLRKRILTVFNLFLFFHGYANTLTLSQIFSSIKGLTFIYFLIFRCEYGKKLKREIIDFTIAADEYEFSSNTDFDSQHILQFYQSPIRIAASQDIITKIKDFQEVEFHRSVAKRQRIVYNEQRNDVKLLKKNVLIEFDFKEKIKTPIGPKEVSRLFRKHS